MQLQKSSNGSLLMLANGSLMGECCCGEVPAPCSCPCESWPPESWPCGGLNETYVATNGHVSPFDGASICHREECIDSSPPGSEAIGNAGEIRIVGSLVFTAGGAWDETCRWTALGDIQRRSIDKNGVITENWTDTEPFEMNLFLNTYVEPCRWQLSLAYKQEGTTPVGTYFGEEETWFYTVPANLLLLMTEGFILS